MGCFAAKIVKNNSIAPTDHPGRKRISTNTATGRSPGHGEEGRRLPPADGETGRSSDRIGKIRSYSRVVSTGPGVTPSGVRLRDICRSSSHDEEDGRSLSPRVLETGRSSDGIYIISQGCKYRARWYAI